MTELIEQVEPSYWRLHGSHEVVVLETPAAGAALTKTVPGSVQWEVVAASFLYTASAAVATRVPFISFLDQAGVTFCKVNTAFNLVATNASQITFGQSLSSFGANSAVSIGAPIPRIRLQDGLRVQLSATLIDTADTITAARLYVCQYDVRPDYT